jgi:N utilization substance protein A
VALHGHALEQMSQMRGLVFFNDKFTPRRGRKTMSQEIIRLIDSISRDRNIDKEVIFTDIEQAMVSAARKHFAAEDTEEFTCTIDRLNGAIQIYHDQENISLDQLGRIPAQTMKQVLIQRLREDERDSILEEYSQRVGELVTGTAQRYEGGALVIGLGRAEGFMPRSEQIPGEQHAAGERVRCLILDVRDAGHQVKIVLSRAHPDFIKRLFEVEVPEVSERVIEIKALAREAGHRTKVAVSSIDSKVDAVGACVGVRGSRIKNIVDELGGEKIDVVRWNESSQVLIANALRPAQIVEISLCFELGRATVVVNEDQLSLAIGKRGQNVRLAARLTNWDVDILTPVEFQKGLDILEETILPVEGVNEEVVDRIAALGLISVFDVEEVGAETLMEHLSSFQMTQEMAQQIVDLCKARSVILAEQQKKDKEEAARLAAEQASTPEQQQVDAILGTAADSQSTVGIMDILGGAAPSLDESTDEAEIADGEQEESGDPPHDVAMADSAGQEQSLAADKSPAEEEIDESQDETEVARLAQGDEEPTA